MKELFIDNFIAIFEGETNEFISGIDNVEIGERVTIVDYDHSQWYGVGRITGKRPIEPENEENQLKNIIYQIETDSFFF